MGVKNKSYASTKKCDGPEILRHCAIARARIAKAAEQPDLFNHTIQDDPDDTESDSILYLFDAATIQTGSDE